MVMLLETLTCICEFSFALKANFCDLNVLLVCQEALTKSLKAFRLRSCVFIPCVVIPRMVISNSKYNFKIYIDSLPKPSLFIYF